MIHEMGLPFEHLDSGATKSLPGLRPVAILLIGCLAALCLLTLLHPPAAQGQSPESPSGGEPLFLNEAFARDARQAIDSVYNQNFDAPGQVLSGWRDRYPDNPVWQIWPALEVWWTVLRDLEYEGHDEELFETMEQVVDYADAYLDERGEHIDALVVRAVSQGFLARHHSNRGNWYSSIRYARRAYNDFSTVEELQPELPDLAFGNGMVKYYLAFLRDEFPVVRPIAWMLPSGDREEGLEILARAAEESIFLIPESIYFLGHIKLHYENRFDDAVAHLNDLTVRYPENVLYRRLLVRAYYQDRRYGQALRIIDDALDHWQRRGGRGADAMREELWTYKGRIHLSADEVQQARDYLEQAYGISRELSGDGPRRFQVMAAYYLGEVHRRNGDAERAHDFYHLAANADLDVSYVDRAEDRLDEHY